jgi:ferritin-like metal-binding protein YciE
MLFGQTLDEESQTDKALTALADASANEMAQVA